MKEADKKEEQFEINWGDFKVKSTSPGAMTFKILLIVLIFFVVLVVLSKV